MNTHGIPLTCQVCDSTLRIVTASKIVESGGGRRPRQSQRVMLECPNDDVACRGGNGEYELSLILQPMERQRRVAA